MGGGGVGGGGEKKEVKKLFEATTDLVREWEEGRW